MPMNRITVRDLQKHKDDRSHFAMLTAYDHWMARLLDDAGIEVLLVGDSLGMVMLGHDSTLPVTMEQMLHHVQAVVRGTRRALVVGDMPFLSYQVSLEETVRNAGLLLQRGGAQAVKLEGGRALTGRVATLVESGIPVMGHLGLTPQSVNQFGGYRVQGRSKDAAQRLLDDALALQEAGAFAVVLECIPAELAERVTATLSIPTIGIGAGVHCDGQVLVTHDMLGLVEGVLPRHVKVFAALGESIKNAVATYKREVEQADFPTKAQSFAADPAMLHALNEGKSA
jgi:3-methyl-2-oxobutanoate hydroxymethyltransferase